MPKIIGIAGDFQKERAVKRRLKAMQALFIAYTVLIFVLGYASSYTTGRGSLLSIFLALLVFAGTIPAFKFFERFFEQRIREARKDEEGATGEREIIPFLQDLPDTYTIVCDLAFVDSYGNIDHLVIGPTGVFAIDVKNWRGIVSSDGNGELLLNGRPTDKPQVRFFTARVMDFRERLKALTLLEPFIQCLFVFPHTRVEAKWGTTGNVRCVAAKQLEKTITTANPARALSPADIIRLVDATQALKSMAGPVPKELRDG